MNPETTLMHRIMFAASRGATRLFRQNVGMAWAGKAHRLAGRQYVSTDRGRIEVGDGDVVIKQARPFHAGIEGIADLGGWKTVTVTADMVGRQIAVYVAAEVKMPKAQVRPEQKNFLRTVAEAGGIAGIVRSEDDAARLLATGTAGTPRAGDTDG